MSCPCIMYKYISCLLNNIIKLNSQMNETTCTPFNYTVLLKLIKTRHHTNIRSNNGISPAFKPRKHPAPPRIQVFKLLVNKVKLRIEKLLVWSARKQKTHLVSKSLPKNRCTRYIHKGQMSDIIYITERNQNMLSISNSMKTILLFMSSLARGLVRDKLRTITYFVHCLSTTLLRHRHWPLVFSHLLFLEPPTSHSHAVQPVPALN